MCAARLPSSPARPVHSAPLPQKLWPQPALVSSSPQTMRKGSRSSPRTASSSAARPRSWPSSEAHCDAIVAAAVEAFGGLDILVVASGQNKVAKIVDQKAEDFLDVMDANVTQSWLMARAAARQMIKQGRGGKIILMSSARGLLGHPAGYTAYCASKSAVDGITKALGCELGATGITVNALGPTVFRSPLTEWMFADDERGKTVRAGFLTRVPKGRLGEPSDLAGPLLFLASRASDFYTGHILYADGGYTAG